MHHAPWTQDDLAPHRSCRSPALLCWDTAKAALVLAALKRDGRIETRRSSAPGHSRAVHGIWPTMLAAIRVPPSGSQAITVPTRASATTAVTGRRWPGPRAAGHPQ